MKGLAIGDAGGRCRAYRENLEEAYPIERELVHENGGVSAFLGTLAGGGSRVVDPRRTADGINGGGWRRAYMMGALRWLRRDT